MFLACVFLIVINVAELHGRERAREGLTESELDGIIDKWRPNPKLGAINKTAPSARLQRRVLQVKGTARRFGKSVRD